jgi:hypothetical protein
MWSPDCFRRPLRGDRILRRRFHGLPPVATPVGPSGAAMITGDDALSLANVHTPEASYFFSSLSGPTEAGEVER